MGIVPDDAQPANRETPVIALNRAIAIANLEGAQAGLEAVEAIPNRERLESYHLLHAILGEFKLRTREPTGAATHFRKAYQLAETEAERQFLTQQLKASDGPPAK